eukprot:12743906-Alexandrium_andersonii.AAC.1
MCPGMGRPNHLSGTRACTLSWRRPRCRPSVGRRRAPCSSLRWRPTVSSAYGCRTTRPAAAGTPCRAVPDGVPRRTRRGG